MKHHPEPASLIGYAAGTLAEPFAILVAAHARGCPACRAEIAELEALGEALTRGDDAGEVSEAEAEALLARLDEAPALSRLPPRPADDGGLPEPLARLFGGAGVPWRRIGPGLEIYRRVFATPQGEQALRFLRADPGVVIPEHGHLASEMTLVVEGVLEDEGRMLGAGDVSEHGEELWHAPVARGAVACVCVIAEEKPPVFKTAAR